MPDHGQQIGTPLTETRDALKLSSVTPSETAIAAAYQVAARILATEGQMIWSRTALLTAINTAVLGALVTAAPKTASPLVHVGVPSLGIVYCLVSFYAFKRAWGYRDFQIAVLRDLEAALHLGRLGLLTRGRAAAEGIDDEPKLPGLRARRVVEITTVLFIAAYVAFLVWGNPTPPAS